MLMAIENQSFLLSEAKKRIMRLLLRPKTTRICNTHNEVNLKSSFVYIEAETSITLPSLLKSVSRLGNGINWKFLKSKSNALEQSFSRRYLCCQFKGFVNHLRILVELLRSKLLLLSSLKTLNWVEITF